MFPNTMVVRAAPFALCTRDDHFEHEVVGRVRAAHEIRIMDDILPAARTSPIESPLKTAWVSPRQACFGPRRPTDVLHRLVL